MKNSYSENAYKQQAEENMKRINELETKLALASGNPSQQEITYLSEQLKQANAKYLSQLKDNDDLRFKISTTVDSERAEQVVRKCLEQLGATYIPKTSDELYKQLELICVKVASEKELLKQSIL